MVAVTLQTGRFPRVYSECEIEYTYFRKKSKYYLVLGQKILLFSEKITMQSITFITGNQKKADYLARYLGFPIEHQKIDLDEIQSLDLREIVEHKVKQAYEKVWKPVIVEDVSLEFSALGRLPGTFIRFFIEEMSMEQICSLLDKKDRSAIARCVFGYYDGIHLEFFEWEIKWSISEKPAGTGGYGFDQIFIPTWYTVTRAELSEIDDQKTYLQMKPFEKVRIFLESL